MNNRDGSIGKSKGEYSVCQFFMDDTYEYVRRFVSAEEAVTAFKHYTTSIAARMGMIKEVIITDGGDCTNCHWVYGKGLVFPSKEQLEQKAPA